MTDWFGIINIQNILLILVGFVIGRYWRLGKKIIKLLNKESQTNETIE